MCRACLPGCYEATAAVDFLLYCKMYNAHCRRVQSLSRWHATSTSQCHFLPKRYIATPQLPPNLLLILGDLDPHLIHDSLDPPDLPPQTASRSSFATIHTRYQRTDRRTDTQIDRCSTYSNRPTCATRRKPQERHYCVKMTPCTLN